MHREYGLRASTSTVGRSFQLALQLLACVVQFIRRFFRSDVERQAIGTFVSLFFEAWQNILNQDVPNVVRSRHEGLARSVEICGEVGHGLSKRCGSVGRSQKRDALPTTRP